MLFFVSRKHNNLQPNLLNWVLNGSPRPCQGSGGSWRPILAGQIMSDHQFSQFGCILLFRGWKNNNMEANSLKQRAWQDLEYPFYLAKVGPRDRCRDLRDPFQFARIGPRDPWWDLGHPFWNDKSCQKPNFVSWVAYYGFGYGKNICESTH